MTIFMLFFGTEGQLGDFVEYWEIFKSMHLEEPKKLEYTNIVYSSSFGRTEHPTTAASVYQNFLK